MTGEGERAAKGRRGDGKAPVFLNRASYRIRRMRDAARFLPIAMAFFWMLPLFWVGPGAEPRGLSFVVVYVFSVWIAAIALSAWLSHVLRDEDPPGAAEAQNQEPAP